MRRSQNVLRSTCTFLQRLPVLSDRQAQMPVTLLANSAGSTWPCKTSQTCQGMASLSCVIIRAKRTCLVQAFDDDGHWHSKHQCVGRHPHYLVPVEPFIRGTSCEIGRAAQRISSPTGRRRRVPALLHAGRLEPTLRYVQCCSYLSPDLRTAICSMFCIPSLFYPEFDNVFVRPVRSHEAIQHVAFLRTYV